MTNLFNSLLSSSLFKTIKIHIVIFLTCFLTQYTYSQERASIGIKLGGGLSRYYFGVNNTFNPVPRQDFVPVYQAGLVFSHLNAKNIGIQVEVQYTEKAWLEKFGESAKGTVLIKYLEAPVLTHIRFGYNKSAWVLNFGFYAAYGYDAKIDTTAGIGESLVKYQDLGYSQFDYGLKGGLGYEISVGSGNFQIQMMYSQGLQNLFDRDPLKIYKSLNQSLFISGIYKIRLFRKKKKKTK